MLMGYRWQWWALLPISLLCTLISAVLYLIEFTIEVTLRVSRYALAAWLPISGWIYTKAWGKQTKAIAKQMNRARWYKYNASVTHC